jgi:nitrogen fixation NifU-like protein
MYNDLVMDHFNNPRNAGTMEDADGVGMVESPGCGDVTRISIKVRDNVIDDVRFQTFGCGAAIATSSIVTEMVKGKSLEEARTITNEDVARALGGLPPHKMHCSNMAADALQSAIDDYGANRAPGAGRWSPSS